MKKLFLILMSVLCVSHQAFTIYNPFQVLLLMPGRAAAVIAYAGKKAGLVSDETSRPTIWLHEEDSLIDEPVKVEKETPPPVEKSELASLIDEWDE